MKKEVTSITLLGEELSIKFNLAVECAYEKIAGKPFDLNDLVSQTSSTALYMAAILESKPDTEITVERLMREATGPEIEQLSKAVVAAMTKWLDMPDVLKKLQKDDKAEKKAKN
jgi:hypothetical protein